MSYHKYEVVYNLAPIKDGLYLPEAFVISRDREGLLAHIQQKATEQTIGSYELHFDAVRQHLFGIIDLLHPKVLEQKFSPPKKAPKPLAELLSQEEVKNQLFMYVHRKLDEFLQNIVAYQLPICLHIERRVLVKDYVLATSADELQPNLYFEKTKEGVRYRLWLQDRRGPWHINRHDIIPITNTPAWLIVDGCLQKLAQVNGNVVKPFLQKREINIPEANVRTYFEKFILKMAATVDIMADGFEVIYHKKPEGCQLEAVRNWMQDEWGVAVRMAYYNTTFSWRDTKEQRTAMEFGEKNDIRISKVLRDFKWEARTLKKLNSLGLYQDDTGYFNVQEQTEDPFYLLEWLSQNREKLAENGFTVCSPQLDGQVISLQSGHLQLNTEQQNDWFDLHGEITVGEFKIPFLAFAKYIREENRLYPLPNGEYFLIPLEWMTKYKMLAQFAKKEGDHLRLEKSQYMLLQDVGLSEDTDVEIVKLKNFKLSKKLKAKLRPYQLEGVKWLVQLYDNDLGACLADDMGLGKTLQTIAVLLHAKEEKADMPFSRPVRQLGMFESADDTDFLQPLNALIILPASLVFNWEAELQKFAPSMSVYKHTGAKRHKDIRILTRFDVILTTYQTALRDVDLLQKIDFEYIILDESQQIKNKEGKAFKAVNTLNARHKISLSGTPIENSLADLWSQMQFINPNLLGTFPFFQREFITPIEKRNDEDKKARLRSLVAPYMLRRTKEEVAKDLPPLTVTLHYCEMEPEQKKLYEKEKSAARNLLLDNYQAGNPQFQVVVLQTLTKLRQLVNHPKLIQSDFDKESGKFNEVLEQWDVIRRSGHKALIFSSFVQYLELFRCDFKDKNQSFAWLVGDLTQKQRKEEIERFQENAEVQSFLISIKSGGAGLNLTAADYVFILDPWWNPFTEQQAIARAHRIGQDKNVIALKFITKDSIEEKILKLQERKSQLAADIIEGAGSLRFSKGELEFLLE